MRSDIFRLLITVTAACCAAHTPALAGDALAEGFQTPPQAAKPRVWWHWMNGMVAEEGVRLDFEWMQRVGVGGVHNFDAALGGGADAQLPVKKPLAYGTPEWRRALRYSVELARTAGLEFAIASSPGFSETGGPWVEPKQAMKKLVWSETSVAGGVPFKGRLAAPPATTGTFQNIPFLHGLPAGRVPAYYADVATIAYRTPATEIAAENIEPKITSSAGTINAAMLRDGDLAQSIPLPFGTDRHAWIQFSFAQPQRIQAITVVIDRLSSFDPTLESAPNGWLEASDDAATFRRVADLPRGATFQSSALQQTAAFAPTTARFFRVVLEQPAPSLFAQGGLAPDAPRTAHQIAELVLHTAARVHRFEDKAGYSTRQIVDEDATPAVTAADAVSRNHVIDLTGKLRADGSLDWTPPAGHWTVLRFGYSLTGRINHPAAPIATGLEVDKLNREHVKTYMETYLNEYAKMLGPELIGTRGLQFMVTDSYEAGAQNWTDDMLVQFRQRRGYDALPWLPVLAGRVMENAAASDRFLWDFRKTLGELIAQAHYGQISASLHQRGMRRYGESHEHLRAFIGDGMEAKKTADIPMSAIWTAYAPPVLGFDAATYDADIRESASVAHIYGKNLVAAESFTTLGNFYGFAPQDLKPIADRELAMGLNRFVIHTSVHQPDSRPGPGLGLGPFGQWFTRKETWAEQAGAWLGYLARSSYLLQQGRFVADIAYLYGEGANVTSLFQAGGPTIPQGYNFDFINADAVLNELSVVDGKLVTRAGMEYRVLALDASTRHLSLPVLRKIRDLVQAGATVTGDRPAASPSLADDESEFRAILTQLWGDARSTRTVGAGKVFADLSLAQTLQAVQVPADVIFAAAAAPQIRFTHRSLGDGELYFISNGTTQAQVIEASFRVSGKTPEMWRADSAAIEPLSYRIHDGRTVVPLQLDPNDALFVVFRQPLAAASRVVPEPSYTVLASLGGSWDVTFPPDRGAPAHVRFDQLNSWTHNADAGVKYFSGTATYAQTMQIRPDWLQTSARLYLDLGEVKNLAEVFVNGRSLAVLWKPPFKLDISDAARAGDNRIEIKVTNLWPNRLIGDKQPGAQRIAFAALDPFKADSPLLPSGLLGPVTLQARHAGHAGRSLSSEHSE